MYFQYIGNDLSQLNSSMIRVFKTKYNLQDTPSLEEVVKDEVMFCAHTVLKAGIENGSREKVKKNRSGYASGIYSFRYFWGEIPVRFLKYLPKKDWLGKFSSWEICWTVMSVVCSRTLASRITR